MRTLAFLHPARFLSALLALGGLVHSASASDHADPMSLNVFKIQQDGEANITDLHAFVVDGNGARIVDPAKMADGKRLVISLCVRRALMPSQAQELKLDNYRFVVHLDLNPREREIIRFFDEAKTPAGEDYATKLKEAEDAVAAASKAVKEAEKGTDPASRTAALEARRKAVESRGALLSAQATDRSMQALYGASFVHPDAIAEEASLEFELGLKEDGVNSQAYLKPPKFEGIAGKINVVSDQEVLNIKTKDFRPDEIYARASIADDPFIFPRFFRRNVVGIVVSIPLTALQDPKGAMLLWATTHRGTRQIDHVGRSLRTQLPRFGYLNDKHPASHVREITRVHDQPTFMEDVLATFIAPLEAHRHYDSAPDVMVYDLSKPAKFPNGRALEDDVARALAAAGETLLVELSYAESRQFPRAEKNDKEFRKDFPYLADRWTEDEIAAAGVGTTAGNYSIPSAADRAAVAPLNFKNRSWRLLGGWEVGLIVVLTLALLFSLHSAVAKWWIVIIAIATVWALCAVFAANTGMPGQPGMKVLRLVIAGGVISLFGVILVFVLGRRSCAKWPSDATVYPRGEQGIVAADRDSSRYSEIGKALFDKGARGRYYDVWGPDAPPLPIYKQTLLTIARGLFRIGKDFAMLRAARRTLATRVDLRWGQEGRGVRRLVHPIGICLEGRWEIDADSPLRDYTGYFAPGKKGRVIARYSLGGNEPRNSHTRSMGLVGKVFPPKGDDPKTPRAHFFTQEDLGGAWTDSITRVQLTNSPPVTLSKRGSGLFAFLFVILALMRADQEPSERQLYEVAELEKPEGKPTKCPRFLRFVYAGPPLGPNNADFRDEILGLIYDPGVPEPQRELVYDIEVSDDGDRSGLFSQHVSVENWARIGRLTFTQAVASYNGDFVVHFHHPVWRNDRHDPATEARKHPQA